MWIQGSVELRLSKKEGTCKFADEQEYLGMSGPSLSLATLYDTLYAGWCPNKCLCIAGAGWQG